MKYYISTIYFLIIQGTTRANMLKQNSTVVLGVFSLQTS